MIVSSKNLYNSLQSLIDFCLADSRARAMGVAQDVVTNLNVKRFGCIPLPPVRRLNPLKHNCCYKAPWPETKGELLMGELPA